MTILDKLSTSLNRRDEHPNQELAKEVAENSNAGAVKELIANLDNKNKGIQSDCIKTLYEIGEQQPALVAPYVNNIIVLLDSSNNRLQWGAMTTLNAIANEVLATLHKALSKLSLIAEKGSVITKDHFVHILVKLAAVNKYKKDALALLNEQMLNSPVNQLPTYAEHTLQFIDEEHKALFLHTFTLRLADVEQETKHKRLQKVIKKLGK